MPRVDAACRSSRGPTLRSEVQKALRKVPSAQGSWDTQEVRFRRAEPHASPAFPGRPMSRRLTEIRDALFSSNRARFSAQARSGSLMGFSRHPNGRRSQTAHIGRGGFCHEDGPIQPEKRVSESGSGRICGSRASFRLFPSSTGETAGAPEDSVSHPWKDRAQAPRREHVIRLCHQTCSLGARRGNRVHPHLELVFRKKSRADAWRGFAGHPEGLVCHRHLSRPALSVPERD